MTGWAGWQQPFFMAIQLWENNQDLPIADSVTLPAFGDVTVPLVYSSHQAIQYLGSLEIALWTVLF